MPCATGKPSVPIGFAEIHVHCGDVKSERRGVCGGKDVRESLKATVEVFTKASEQQSNGNTCTYGTSTSCIHYVLKPFTVNEVLLPPQTRARPVRQTTWQSR